jgi:hypothetical protein
LLQISFSKILIYFLGAISSFPLQSGSKNNLFSIAQKELSAVALIGKKTIVFFAAVFPL